ncbi:early nodulin-like protein 18 [Miscanthus floridulus]|uniref:early nodulin-like protein 18 n=1 Tax=Miscanthus floridulus TaxID=154761 RepID=UPI003459013D
MARRIAGVVALALLSVLMAATCAAGRDFYVGGHAGWAPNPAEPFNAWAERNRFQVNDTLVFRYNKGADAVLVVSQGHYDACNATEPALRLDDGDSRFVFHASGAYFFISPDAARCRAGERLIVVVLAVRDDVTSSSPPPKPSSSPAPPPPTSTSPPPPPPAPHALPTPPPPHPVPGKNASSPSQSPVPAPAPAPGTNGTSSPPPSPSSAIAFRGGFLTCLLIGGAAILV